jgi:asparagine synthase (glutamine-hydrolysing)
MCGILGVEQKKNEVSEKLFSEALLSIRNRGKKVYIYSPSASARYAYMRLPTDGLRSPVEKSIQNETLPILLYNGILNNVDELKRLFKIKLTNIDSDYELLKQGLGISSETFLPHCRGMFAFAYITENKILLGRDTIGIKPLYYIFDGDVFAFASEMKALMLYKPKRIFEVKPGEIIVFDRVRFSLQKKLFHYQVKKKSSSLETLLYQSLIVPTRRYLAQSEKPMGFLLSGGLDSSVLCAFLHAYLKKSELKRIHYFCVGITDADDRKYALLLEKKYHLNLELIYPKSSEKSLNVLEKMIYKVESSYSRVIKVALLQDELAKVIAKKGIEVVISGEGADELFYGYRKFIDGLTLPQIHTVYKKFFDTIFYRTLLQRLDRTFAQRCIEGRVPFLDQAIVAYAESIPNSKKVTSDTDGIQTKIPLRILAKKLGLPIPIVERKKTTMTLGATLQENKEDEDGYLELFFKKKTGGQSTSLIKKLYNLHFSRNGNDILEDSKTDLRQQEINMVKEFRSANAFKSKVLL